MRGSDYAELAAFVAVVDQGSFAKAAKRLRIAPSSLSQTVKRLEERLGVQVLHRTTRSVSMTGAGVRLFDRFKPAMAEMEAAVIDLRELSSAPAGLVRLHMPRAAYARLLEGRFGGLYRCFPKIQLEVVIDDVLIDIIRAGFDLDVRLSGALDASTTAVAIGGPVRHVAVASQAYLAEHGAPATPTDLLNHRCIQWRRPDTDYPYRWVFMIDGCTTQVDVEGPLTVSHCELAVAAAIQSVGIAFVLEQHAGAAVARREIELLLTSFLPKFPGWSVCHPRAGILSAAAQAVIQFLAESASTKLE
ncbi:LysR family transcriptional regulator [Lichenifustis flavocetrariae]|uniref:LysR family transcriptional regulator n=1 Tax=Lichenifustis flavocetrariae TaxID=2949735 RepID=A0AA42CL59_9HYPH|nr:LysR family transcriptional regulator [Lichenifustis flavocetrariae]MCW6510036.1 LysR family transcriptional regulator [Lichenifustis flavocetrariae]